MADRVGRRPDGAPGEQAGPVHVQGEPVALDVVVGARPGGERPEAGPPGIDRQRAAVGANDQAHVVELRRAMGVRPPARDARDAQLPGEGRAVVDRRLQRDTVSPGRPVQLDVDAVDGHSVETMDTDRDRQHAGVAVEPRPDTEAVDLDGPPPLEDHRAPRTDDHRPRREPGRAAQERGPEPAQVPVADEAGAPAGAGLARLGEPRSECQAADRQLVRPADPIGEVQLERREHRLARRDQRAVQPHLGEARDALEPEDDPLTVDGRGRVESRPEPPVSTVEVRGRGQVRVAIGACDRARHRRRDPIEVGSVRRGRSRGRARRDLPAGHERGRIEGRADDGNRGGHDGHGVSRWPVGARSSPRSRHRPWRRSTAPGRTAAGGPA